MISTTEAPHPPLTDALRAERSRLVLARLLRIGATAYQAVALLAFVAALFLASGWLKTPFIGALFEQTLVFNGARPSGEADTWDLYNQGIRFGDRLLSVNNQPVRNTAEVRNILGGFFPGETIPVTIQSASGETRTLPVKLNAFPDEDRTVYFVLPAVVSALFLLISLWIFRMRGAEWSGRAFAVFSASLSLVSGSFFDLYTTHVLTPVWTLGLAIAGGALVDLALSFPHEFHGLERRPWLRAVGYVLAIGLSIYAFTTLYDFGQPLAYVPAWRLVYAFAGLASLVYLGINIYYGVRAQSPVIKTQARMIVAGSIIAFGPATIWLLSSPLNIFDFSPYLFLPFVIFPLTLGYTILRFRFVRADDWVRQGTLYILLSILIVGGYALLVTGLSIIFKTSMPASNTLWIGGLVFVLAILLDPIRTRLQGFVDGTFFRGERAYSQTMQDFSHELTAALDLASISRLLRQRILTSVTPDRIHIFTYDSLNDQYVPLPGDDGRPTTDIHFPTNGPLTRYFASEQLPLYLDGASMPAALQSEQSRLTILGARLFVRLPGSERPVGWLALGPRLSGLPYTPRDLTFLDNLADQASIAIQRVQTVANLERRVQEMNALTRVSQGVNITLTFDDVLELIYAQVAQVIPTSHFYITLYNKVNDYFYNGFVVEDNDRITPRENIPFAANVGLIPEVIRRARPVLTQDHARECQARGVQNDSPAIYAWMGVPLNAGAESIGALSVGTHDSGTIYARAQMDLLQAIADQTAGAIVKARLLQEAEQRARQLGTLNDMTRQLTSTLELEPLLQNILQSAVGILNCEAGTLFLVEEQTRELVFRVTTGPLDRELIGHHLPPGSGIVGRAVTTASPIIENNVKRAEDWSGDPETRTDFEARAVLAVPLLVKDSVIGVIEVMNRKDGLPFVAEDMTLLTAFGGQAAVAMENARLYTLTDQELADRVEELSVMQRIDRELNASLETGRAMRITLEWALRQSNAEAGLVGMVEGDKLDIVAHEGYGDLFLHSDAPSMPLNLPALQAAIETGLPQRMQISVPGTGSLLRAARNQVVIPIRREASVIGLLILESSAGTQADLPFLSRLSDHAAIAISNAQLYAEVQRANIAKSEFVSLVAHELKNPMTSIKGYTELLSGGAVGPINEMQSNFLRTIHSNTERMSTLVSDLNDNSKIEAGRLRLDFKAVELHEVVDEVVRSTKRQIDDKKQAIQVLMPDLPKVWGDRTRVAQVLVNLVSNAHKYTPESGVLIVAAELSENRWDPEGARKVVHMWVKDNGIGISPEDQAKIFQKFFRSEDQKAREAPGTGLGLNITRSLVEMQGGRIWFESVFREGTTFHFTIPVAEG